MWRFSIFGFRVSVHWIFWLICLLLVGGDRIVGVQGWLVVLVQVAAVFVSILVHELGHALAGRHFGAFPTIAIHGFGGTTFLPGRHFSRKEHILVTAAGPLAGLGLGVLCLLLWTALKPQSLVPVVFLNTAIFVNFFWTFINLLPIQPMDGGQILREALGPRRLKLTCWIGFICALVCGLLALSIHFYILAMLLGVMAYFNFTNRTTEGGVVTR